VSEERFESKLEDLFSSDLKHYYVHPAISYLFHDIESNYVLDNSGVPVIHTGLQSIHNPVTIARYALAIWELYLLDEKSEIGRKFLKIADWFCQNCDNGRWNYSQKDILSNLPAGWISAMSQGMAISVLLRAFSLTKKKKYLETSDQAMKWFEKSCLEGGVTHRFEVGSWFEEYPNPQKPAHVFNGHCFALFGIWDHYRITGKDSSKKLFEFGITALINQIQRFDNGYWVIYDQRFRSLVNASYMDLQLKQLEVLSAINSDKILSDKIKDWQDYWQSPKILPKLIWIRWWQKLREIYDKYHSQTRED
jgi:hypothetical protein